MDNNQSPKLLPKKALETRIKTENDNAAYVSHELRNHFNAINGTIEEINQALQNGTITLPDDLKCLVKDSLTHGFYGISIIENMLNYSKLLSGKMVLSTDMPFQISVLSNDCFTLIKHLAKINKNELVLDCVQMSNFLLGSPLHLKQVLVNLLANACKFTTFGEIKLTVENVNMKETATLNDEKILYFCVDDTGCGIPKNKQDAVFEEYVQEGVKIGTGLGLPLCRQFVSLMGGKLEVLSPVPGKKNGTRFHFTIAFKKQHIIEENEVVVELPSIPSNLKVLITDDENIGLKILKRKLESKVLPHICTIKLAHTGEEALKMMIEEQFDIVFLDEHYGKTGGVKKGTDISREFREQEQEGKRCIIIGCSGDGSNVSHHEMAKQAGQDAVWSKPLPNIEEMKRQLQHFFL